MTTDDITPAEFGPEFDEDFGPGEHPIPWRAARDWIVNTLDGLDLAAVMVHADIPGNISPPAVVIRPAEEWISANTYGGWEIQLAITPIVSAQGGAEHALRRLEVILWAVLERLGTLPRTIQGPALIELNGGPALTTDVIVTLNETKG